MSFTKRAIGVSAALLVTLYACDFANEPDKKPVPAVEAETLVPGEMLNIKATKANTDVELTSNCTGVELYQLQGDKLQKDGITTDAEGAIADVFYISRATIPSECKLEVGNQQFNLSSSIAEDNTAHGLINFLGKWRRQGDTNDQLQVGLGEKPSATARLFVSTDGGQKWEEHTDLQWTNTNTSSLTYNAENTDHNQVLLQVGKHWSFIAVPATETVFMHRMFKVSNIWHVDKDVLVKVDGIATDTETRCMAGFSAFHIHADKVQQFTTNGLTLTPDASGSLDNILLMGTPVANCTYVLHVGGALSVLSMGNDSDIPSINAITLAANDSNKVQVTLPATKPDGIDANIELYVLDEFLEWHKDDVTEWVTTPIATDVDWVDAMHHALLKITKSKTDYWFYQ